MDIPSFSYFNEERQNLSFRPQSAVRFLLPNTKERLRKEQSVELKKRVPSSLHSPNFDPHLSGAKGLPFLFTGSSKGRSQKGKESHFPANLLALDCRPGSMERQPRSILHQDENHAFPPNTIFLFLSRPAKQRIQPQIPFS
ncbi:hypothetical protein HAX54_031207 [Datura stramonium]|uniref:Uncharacterized protein n=1 Tax=Datura stramonium TaxID=4076 RepID=A0ABS8V9U8_DATST|nr:hypothetical protein [Datura stramonium]